MRSFLLFLTVSLVSITTFGQKANVVSAASDWTTLGITATDTVATAVATKPGRKTKATKVAPAPVAEATKPTAKTVAVATKTPTPKAEASPVVASDTKPAATKATEPTREKTTSFLETFADNHNGWLVGKRNGFVLEVAKDSYYIRKEKPALTRPGRSYIKLPNDLNLNKADTFTVSVEMVVPVGSQPDGGLLIGVKDTNNYCQFRLIGTQKVSLYTRVNGTAMASYMPGKPTNAKVPIDPVRNTLTIRRTGDDLHFYVNGKEVEDSPHPYRNFKGNSVGFISFTDATKFQYLTVQVGK
ncbi:hypothetical protein J2I47_00500 [Fibrella sp. HMF5335]|uniref:3-keto-disaccharide hydrolase domain-containing protein n=1 Tax=Fibrella rubiginis TaxID=2817060 RepID=A0A939GEL6_9BACT|nr:hypothetical protein [Fibrella rubiginis]MBO0935013.1 hypothetical protein [Fibrella rubiginis]